MDSYKIKQCIHNDRVAQKELYDLYKTNMFVLCMRYFSEQEEAKDALQDGFIKVFRDLYQFKRSLRKLDQKSNGKYLFGEIKKK